MVNLQLSHTWLKLIYGRKKDGHWIQSICPQSRISLINVQVSNQQGRSVESKIIIMTLLFAPLSHCEFAFF
jgi:hypothetical protein